MNPNLKRRLQLMAGFSVFIVAVVLSYFSIVDEDPNTNLYQDIFLVIDVSGSMADDLKLEYAKQAALEFVNVLEHDETLSYRLGLIVFSDQAKLVTDLSKDFTGLKEGISRLQPLQSTAMGDGILLAVDSLGINGTSAQKTMILLSDGASNAGVSPYDAVLTASSSNVVIMSVGYGFDADVFTLQTMASTTGGTYFNAPTGQDLAGVFGEIADLIISPVSHYSSRIMVLVAIPILLFIPAIEIGITTMMGRFDDTPVKRNASKQACPHCTHSNRPTAKFCLKCGKSLNGDKIIQDTPVKSNASKQACPHCTHSNRATAKFCLKCGKSLNGDRV